MNCQECQENLVDYLEGALENAPAHACKEHLDECPACRSEQAAIAALQQRLVAHSRLARSQPFFAAGVINRINEKQTEKEKFMCLVNKAIRWGLPFGTAVAGLAIAGILFLGSSPKTNATAVAVMERGAKAVAKVDTLHLTCRARTAPRENFMNLSATADFTAVEVWKEFSGARRWRIEKLGRVAVMDGQSSVMLIKPRNAIKGPASPAAFETRWLHDIANLSQTIEGELRRVKAYGWAVQVRQETPPGGSAQAVVSIDAKCGLPDSDYLKNKYFDTADTRRVYRFDDQTERLEGMQVFLQTPAGEVLVFEITQIQYDPALAASVFALELPPDVDWYKEPQVVPDHEKYAALTAEQAARTFFEACAREDWQEVAAFWPLAVDDSIKKSLGGLRVVSLGKAFTSQAVPDDVFVPYEIQLKDGGIRKHNLALKKHPRTGRWFMDGGI